jgi:tRNA (adenine57-N1/adenine58-N1)-methyltransferase
LSNQMIEEGSKVLLIDDRGRKHIATAQRGMIDVRGLGVIDGDLLCESGWGDSLSVGENRLLMIEPDVNDILELIERKAQIITPKDSYQIPLRLNLGAGCRVIEGGLGSGALTVVLLRTVAPDGKVFSYELREDHASTARRNIALSEHKECLELRIANICTASLEKDVDAVVLDIPNPWDAMANVCASLKVGGRMCTYVPNINQLEASVRSMRDSGLAEIFSFETLLREISVHPGGVRPCSDMIGHTGYLTFGRKVRRLQGQEQRRGSGLLKTDRMTDEIRKS